MPMDIPTAALLALQHLSPAAKAAVVARLGLHGLIGRYPFFAAAMAVSAGCQAWLLWSWWTAGDIAYRATWRVVTPIQVAASLAIAVEALWLLVSHFPKRRNLMVLVGLVGGVVAAATVLPTSWVLPGEGLQAVRRHWKAGMWMVLGLSRLILGDVEPNMRTNVQAHVTAVLVAMGGASVGDAISSAFPRDYWPQVAGRLLLIGSPLVACLWWWRMDGDGEGFTPTPGPSREDLDTEWEQITKEIKSRAAGAGE